MRVTQILVGSGQWLCYCETAAGTSIVCVESAGVCSVQPGPDTGGNIMGEVALGQN